ncbi:MAG: hypothetical protein JWN85_5004 [Gammaproteobacteria bacterium]|nr:hypothetical protein [Gammaproteobacteria bacterium]
MRKVQVGRRRACAAVLVAACLGWSGSEPAHAVGFKSASGDLTGSWDTTLSFGQGWRVSGQDCRLIASADGGCGRSPNIDDGDLNYAKADVFSRALKAVTEVSVNYKDTLGAFVRGSGLYDFAVMDGSTRRTPLSHEAKDLVGSYTRLLDAFGFWRFHLGTLPSELRLGNQVVSWGESTFIQGGLNTVNHFDVSALRVPGSELKEALMPDPMAVFNLQLSDHVSSQFLYLFSWHDTRPEPAGSYFSTNDFGVPGGQRVQLGFGEFSDQGVDFRPLGGALTPGFETVARLPNRTPRDAGQYGVNFKFYLPNFNNGTEFGLYFLNYHSRLPVISAVTGTQAGVGNAFGALNAVGAAAQALAAGLPYAAAVATGAAVGAQQAAKNGGNLSAALAQQYATIGANTLRAGGDVTAQATNIATSEYAKTAGYFAQFPENIRMIGASFNTQVQKTGTALQGEVTYRHNVPLQFDDVELLYAALTPFESGIANLRGTPLPPTCLPGAGATLTRCNQLGAYGVNQEVRGWGLHDMWQAQFTATQSFAGVLKASQLILVFESAVDFVPDLQNKNTGGPVGLGLRYEAPGTAVSGNAALAGFQFGTVEPGNRFPDRTSWGYVLAGRLEYPNLLGAWNILPNFSWQHDVNGTSPGPGGNFVQGRHGLTLGIGANLQSTWGVDVSWAQFGGAGQYNLLNDRDFVEASVKYSF